MDPSPEAVAAIRERVAAVSSWAKTDGEVLADLVADAVPNPAPRGQLPKEFELADLIAVVPEAGRAGLGSFVGPAAPLVMAQDRKHLLDGIRSLLLLRAITQADSDAMVAILDATLDDPAWPATVPAISVTIGRPIDPGDVTAARPI